MARGLFTGLLLLLYLPLFADSHAVDSLEKAIARANADTVRIRLLIALSKEVPAGDTAHILEYARQALNLARQAGNRKYVMDGYENLGRIYCFRLKEYDKAIVYFRSLDDIAKQSDDTLRRVFALGNLLITCKYLQRYGNALEYGNRALLLQPASALQVGILGNMGNVYLEVGDYARAMDCLTRSLDLAQQVLSSKKTPSRYDSLPLAGLSINIGNVYAEMKEYDKAIRNYDNAIAYNVNTAIAALMGKGDIYGQRGDYPGAISLYRQALAIIGARQQLAENTVEIYTALAGLYLKTNDMGVAERYADSALNMARMKGEENRSPGVYITFAKINSYQKKYAAAADNLNKAIKMAATTGMQENEDEAWRLLSDTYEAMKRPEKALHAYRRYISIRDSLYNVEKARDITRMDLQSAYAIRRIADSAESVKQAAVYTAKIQQQRIAMAGVLASLAMVLLLVYFIFRNYSLQKQAATEMGRANEKINEEKQVSESLLLNILPEEVARELKASGSVKPRLYENVTVLFTDFVNFTVAGGRITPQQLVEELHQCFKAFDSIIGKHSIEKIKTVGDAYIAVSGLPQPNENHAADIVNAAREIRDYMLQRKNEFPDSTFEIRIGINSGTVVAGIVGVKKFAYDIWGDTVNVAARMEQHGEAGKVNVSEATRQLLGGEFVCHARGLLPVKNKGEMNMYFVD